MNIYRIHPAPCEPHICTTMADSPAEALALVKQNDWMRQQLTSDACAFEVEEVMVEVPTRDGRVARVAEYFLG